MNVNLGGINGSVFGVCPVAMTPVLTFSAVGGISGKAQLKIHRSVGTQSAYRVDGYLSSHPSAIATQITADTAITSDVNLNVTIPYAVVVVSIRKDVGEDLYQIDYMVY